MGFFSRFFKRGKKAGSQGNGNGSKRSHHFIPEPSNFENTASSDSPSQVGVASDTALPWLKGLWWFGKRRARTRGSYRLHEETVGSLREDAIATANANTPLPWDPNNNAHDSQLMDDLKKLQSLEIETTRKHDDDMANLEERERERANNFRKVSKPSLPIITMILTAAFIALTLAPSFYAGLFSNPDDEQLAWLLSSVLGLVGAGSIVSLIMGGINHAD